MRNIVFRGRDLALAFALSVPIGALIAAITGAVLTVESRTLNDLIVVTVIAAILGLIVGPIAALGAFVGYLIARRVRVRSMGLFRLAVAFGAGTSLVVVILLVVLAEYGSFVSESFDGRPSNPWLDWLPIMPIAFALAFVPAWFYFQLLVRWRIRHVVVAGPTTLGDLATPPSPESAF